MGKIQIAPLRKKAYATRPKMRTHYALRFTRNRGNPVRRVDELKRASQRQLARIEISPFRDSIQFPDIDASIYVPGLLADMLSPLIRPELSRRASRKGTPKKAAAVRENGKKGGRPKKKAAVR
jgi:hypothetical protein